MLEHSFCHIRGIGLKAERDLWSRGVTSWQRVSRHTGQPLSPAKWRLVEGAMDSSRNALRFRKLQFFDTSLPRSERWRLIPHLERTAYLDIETSGLTANDSVTTIALYDGTRVHTYVRGKNLDQFAQDIQAYDSIVTFNGSCFDLPVLTRTLNITFHQTHIDLRFIFASLGVRGGLKSIEQRYGVGRHDMEGVDGFTAVLLWQQYVQSTCSAALETLLAYNTEDVLSLARLAGIAFNAHRIKLPIQQEIAELPPVPPGSNPHQVDREILSAILIEQHGNSGSLPNHTI